MTTTLTSPELEARFFAKVREGDPPAHRPELGPCLLWTGAVKSTGYGHIWRDGKVVLVHRYALELRIGRLLAPDELARHECDTPLCVRHLIVGGHGENVHDMMDRGRHVTSPGSRNGNARLTERDVAEIRARHAEAENLSISALATAYGVTGQTIRRIVKGLGWSHVAAASHKERN